MMKQNKLNQILQNAWKPPKREKISDWINNNYVLSPENAATPGKIRLKKYIYTIHSEKFSVFSQN